MDSGQVKSSPEQAKASPGQVKASPTKPAWSPEQDRLLADWHRRAWASQSAHYSMATRLRRRNVWLGLPVVILSTVVGTSVFATLSRDTATPDSLKVVVGSLSVLAAILAALQTFLRFAARGEQHTLAADWYAAVRREMEEIMATPHAQREKPVPTLDRLRKEMNKIGSQAPMVGEKAWADAASRYGVPEPLLTRPRRSWWQVRSGGNRQPPGDVVPVPDAGPSVSAEATVAETPATTAAVAGTAGENTQ